MHVAAEIVFAGFLSRLDRGSLRSGTVVVLFCGCRDGNRDSGCLGHLIPFCRFALRSMFMGSRRQATRRESIARIVDE
ncbi:hypothetical protein CH274_09325 [Rhodococcus sp. 06-418-5]|nr:hypothetical protein CH274_09325 [Rhodococcus sp. 06-418-5]OZD77455.1 hypothetical protein CH273_18325 [Rhodococcus sp. 05-339-2]